MKLPAKPKTSPGRTDEFPPPLIMFPRSKSTRGSRSRANPMFVRKINNANEANQEPSSPKVTCIGQVRVKRLKLNNKQTTSSSSSAGVRRCKLLRKIKSRWFRRVWRGRISFFRCDCCRETEKLQESTENQIKREIGDVIGACNDELISEPPPRNAFLLTRSRSAPYRYSTAVNRIWELDSVEDEREDDETRKKLGDKMVVKAESDGVNEEEQREDEGSIDGDEEFKAKLEPLNLSRCKSEPARTGDKLYTSFRFSSSS